MASNLHFIRPSVWDKTFRRLSKEAKVVAFYVWTCPTRISEGIFALAPGHVVADTGLTEKDVLAAFEELSAAKLIAYDDDTEVVLDRLALKRNPIRNGRDKETGEIKVDKRIQNVIPRFAQVPDSPLKVEFVALADLYSPDLAVAIRAEGSYAYPPSDGPSDGPLEGAAMLPNRKEKTRRERNRVESTVSTSTCERCHFSDAVEGSRLCSSCTRMEEAS